MKFKDCSIVSCGILSPELNFLKESGFIDADRVLYTMPGLHEEPRRLKEQLLRQLFRAKKYSSKVIIIYGSRCYIDSVDPAITIDSILEEQKAGAVRIEAKNCIDVLAGAEQREEIACGDEVYWLSPGWLKYWRRIFKGWDAGLANETFPKNDKAVVLDALGSFDMFSENYPEEMLAFSDWMKIPIESRAVSLERFKKLLSDCLAGPREE
jgi:hypothetical protein